MLTDETKKDIEQLFDILIDKLKKNNMIRNISDSIYQDISSKLFGFYKYGETDVKMKNVLNELENDVYINIIPLFYKNRYTIDNIADLMSCDTSTVVRNKKRLCTAIYLLLQQEK